MAVLFLDRDGVINQRLPGKYVESIEQFQATEGLQEAMRLLSGKCSRIFVLTNQAGIGKGLMTELQLAEVHRHLHNLVAAGGGRIDGIYFCPHRSDAACTCRKPATGMAWQALADFPDIDFEEAWMVGDSVSDMEFARRLGIKAVLIRGKLEELPALRDTHFDYAFDSLLEFARWFNC